MEFLVQVGTATVKSTTMAAEIVFCLYLERPRGCLVLAVVEFGVWFARYTREITIKNRTNMPKLNNVSGHMTISHEALSVTLLIQLSSSTIYFFGL